MSGLRPYQLEIVEGCRQAFREGERAVQIQLPTGGGKTRLGAFMVGGAARKRKVCWWLVHRRELASQASRTFLELSIPHGTVQAGHISDPHALVQVASIQTIARRLDRLHAPDLIVFDESHHIGAKQWQQVYEVFPLAQIVGLSATPWRLDGVGLGRWFGRMVEGPPVADLIEQGFLSPYRLFAPSTADVSAIKKTGGDYQRDQLAAAMDKPAIIGDAITHYRRLCPGRRAVNFAVSIEHSRHCVEQFLAAGIPAEHVDGEMGHDLRDAAVARFIAGETLVLSNADLLGEGFDVPAIEAAILQRPTASLSLYLQQVGRALRPAPGKPEAIILDHAGNALRHGLPDDDREWTLDDRAKKKGKKTENEVPIRQCPECFRVHTPAPKCPQCGHVYEIQSREVEQREGELAEVDLAAIKRQRKVEEWKAETVDDLVKIGIERGYKNPGYWAQMRFRGKQQAAERRAASQYETYARHG